MNDLKTPQRLDPEQTDRVEAFRGALPSVDPRALGLALTTGAFALAARPAFGQSMPSVTDVLNFALLLEYLERDFYVEGNASGVITANASGEYDAEGKYAEIAQNEEDHVTFLENQLGGDARNEPVFDFTAGGAFSPFTSYTDFLVLSQGFEDTGVRAYKGGAPALIDNDAVLTAALQIHSAEARHAAIVRRLVAKEGIVPEQEAWIERAGANSPSDALAPVYAGMDETVKYQIDVVANSDVDEVEVTESFDEALGIQAVLEIVDQFVVGEDLDGDGDTTG
jgi:rubrerythrin